jgi:hypothetical protein
LAEASINPLINQMEAYDMADTKPVWVIAATMQLPAKHGMQSQCSSVDLLGTSVGV